MGSLNKYSLELGTLNDIGPTLLLDLRLISLGLCIIRGNKTLDMHHFSSKLNSIGNLSINIDKKCHK